MSISPETSNKGLFTHCPGATHWPRGQLCLGARSDALSFSGNFERQVTRCTTSGNPPCRGNFSPCKQKGLPRGKSSLARGGGGVMPYMCHTETCRRSGYILFRLRIRDRVSFFEPDSKCQICTITPSQGAYSQYCLAPSHWF